MPDFTMGNEYGLVAAKLRQFLEDNTTMHGSAQRYDADIDDSFAKHPHIDLYLARLWYKPQHHGRTICTEKGVTRLAKLTLHELGKLVHFAQRLEDEIPAIEVLLSRFDAGRCVFVITPKQVPAD
jgi:hypothetical protein